MKILIPFIAAYLFFLPTKLSAQTAQIPVDSIAQDSIKMPEKIYLHIEQMPEYPGGLAQLMRYIFNNIIYPEAAIKNQIEGTVYVKFVVDDYGNILMPVIVRGLTPECDAEAIRLVNNMPTWVPGKQGGEPVAVYYTIPIKFTLPQ